MVWVRALMVEALATLNIRSISTGPSPDFAVALARPLSTARAAASASKGSVLPRRRRVAWSGWLTSIASTPSDRRWRITPGLLPWFELMFCRSGGPVISAEPTNACCKTGVAVAEVVRDTDAVDVSDTDLHTSRLCKDDAPFRDRGFRARLPMGVCARTHR